MEPPEWMQNGRKTTAMTSSKVRNGDLATLADVARKAGVSPATVSRYLRSADSIKPRHRAPISEAIRELSYVPNAAARALASSNSHMIGSVFPRIDSLLFSMVYETLQKRLAEDGYTLVVSSSDYDTDMEYAQVRNLVANRVDAIVLIGTSHKEETLDLIRDSGIPFLLAACWNESCDLPQIGFCNEAAAGDVAQHLVDLGHEEIAVILGGQESNDRAAARLNGIRPVLKRHGIALPEHRVFRCEFSFENGGRGLRHFMSGAKPPTAIICGSDILAAGALFEAQRMGMRVPDEISIAGFDDTELSRMVHPTLTSLRTPRREVAFETAEALLTCLKEDRPLQSKLLPTQLMARESTGKPAAIKRSKAEERGQEASRGQ